MHFRLGSDGRGQPPHRGARPAARACPSTRRCSRSGSNKFKMDGPKVWDFAVDTVPEDDPVRCSDEHDLEPRIWTW